MADFSDTKRVLVRSTNWLGDVVMSLPALRAIRRGFPQAHLGVMIQSKLAPLFEGTNECDEVVAFERPARCLVCGWRGRSALYSRLRSGNWDLGVLFPNSFSSAWFLKRGGVRRRLGYSMHWRGWTLTDRLPAGNGPLAQHQVHWYLDVARHVGAEGDASDCVYEPPAAAMEAARSVLSELGVEPGSYVAIAPAAAYGPAKEWPADHYARLADMLSDERGLRTLIVGAPAETAKCEDVRALAAAKAEGVVSAAGKTDVAALAGVFKLSAGFVGNDSGAMHLAGVVGVPTVGIFGSTQAHVTGPLGPKVKVLSAEMPCVPCLGRECSRGDYECLVSIAPEAALEALAEAEGAGRAEGAE